MQRSPFGERDVAVDVKNNEIEKRLEYDGSKLNFPRTWQIFRLFSSNAFIQPHWLPDQCQFQLRLPQA